MESIKNIGIVDFDLLTTKQLCYYNLGVLLLSSYYLERGIKPRLILNLSYDNLKKYKKIYIFKDYSVLQVYCERSAALFCNCAIWCVLM